MNENDIGDFKTFLKLAPPLRSEDDRLSLVKGIKENLIDVIVSDHIPEDEESKDFLLPSCLWCNRYRNTFVIALEMYHNRSTFH